jgi:hypothetical protein
MPAGRNQFDPDRRGGREDAQARMARTLARLDVAMKARRREREALIRRVEAAREAREAALAAGRHALERRFAAARIVLGNDFEQLRRMSGGPGGARKPPRPAARRRGLDGGEPVPASPRPKPLPLLGGAEAPLD